MPNAAGRALRWPILSAHPLYFGQRSTRKSAQSFLGTDLIGPTMKGLKLWSAVDSLSQADPTEDF